MRTVERSELQPRVSYDMEAAARWRRPATLSFALEGGAVVEGEWVRVTGWLVNGADVAAEVVVFPVGADGLTLEPAPGHAARRPPRPGEPPRVMPAPPPPELFTLPPLSRLRYQTALRLSDWEWLPGKARELEWTFQLWDEPKPRGRLTL